LCSTHMYYCRGRIGIGIRNRRPEIVIISIINEPLLLKKTTVVLSLVKVPNEFFFGHLNSVVIF
jgi:hypothetical protein